MKASSFPREYRVYNLEESRMMKQRELEAIGFSIAPDGLPVFREKPFDCVVMWKTGLKDKLGHFLYEGDICKLGIVNEFGSMTMDYAIMRYVAPRGSFILQLPAHVSNVDVEVAEVVRLGNEFENSELKDLVKEL